MNHFCTITTFSHLYKVYALSDSLRKNGDALLHVLITDSNTKPQYNGCCFYSLSDIENHESASIIMSKYQTHRDKFRWSLKPVFMSKLLDEKVSDKMIYLDNDLFFFSNYDFLFNLLDQYALLLTPHYYKYSPKREQNWFEANFRVGLFNAGFVGANKNARQSLQWWADCCAYRCEKNSFRGLFDDQKYLDLLPIMNPDAHIIRHQGCNVAGWNTDVCKRSVVNYKVMINEQFPIVFIHFNETTVREIVKGSDALLYNYYHAYVVNLKTHYPELREKDLLRRPAIMDRVKFNLWKIITEFGI